MDVTTLLICAALVSGIMALFISALYVTSREEAYLYDWVVAGFFFFSASFLGLFGSVFELPNTIYPSLNNALYVCAHALIYTGVRKLVNPQSIWRMVVLLFCFILLLQSLPFIQGSVNVRILTFYPIITFFNIIAVWQLWKYRDQDFSKSFILLAICLVLFVVQNIIRGAVHLFSEVNLTFIDAEFMKFTGTLSLIAFVFLLTLSMTVIVTWKKEVKLQKVTRTDSLTGWNNRRALSQIAAMEFERAERLGFRVGFVLLDIDFFKRINDRFGHQIGDDTLVHFCRVVEQSNREYDHHFRLGGEEFAVLVCDTDEHKIREIAERIRRQVESCSFKQGEIEFNLTTSVGWALNHEGETDWGAVRNRADCALYDSKQNGRNLSSGFTPVTEAV